MKGAHTAVRACWIRLDDPIEYVDDIFAGALYLSLNRGFISIPVLSVREVDVFSRLPVEPNEITRQEIQGGPQIVNSVSENHRETLGNALAHNGLQEALAGLRIVLDNRRIWISCGEVPNPSIEIIDVLIGPFDL